MTTRTDIINRALAAISAQADIADTAENSTEAGRSGAVLSLLFARFHSR